MLKKKVAILTLPLGLNYGGIIQNYALQKVLININYYPVTIRLVREKFISIRSLKAELKYLIRRNENGIPDTQRIIKIVTQNTSKFIKENINTTSKIKGSKELKKFFKENHYEVIIVGSDQVWRPKYTANLFDNFLDFLNMDKDIIKIAYAASFGTKEWEYNSEQTKKCSLLARKFNAISVREDSGVKLCNTFFGVEAVNVLDPTLLLTANDYSQLIKLPKSNKGLFKYVLDDNIEVRLFIKKIAIQLGLSISNAQPQYDYYNQKSRNVSGYIFPSIESWLQGFRDADYIITDSYHGTIFSIINKKPFLTIVNQKRGASRFISLLSQLGLLDRIVYDYQKIDKNVIYQNIDFSKVYEKLNRLITYSNTFLKQNLNSEGFCRHSSL